MSTKSIPYYYLPQQIMNEKYEAFSVESKMLFSMIFTNAEHIKAIKETAQLIEKIDEKELYEMRHMLERMQELKEEAEEQ